MIIHNNQSRLPLALCVMGPTATGKTVLALALHEVLDVDLISVDSAMVYRELNIGSAKPSTVELARAPHRLIDLVSVTEPYSAGRFRDDALREMRAISEAGRVPLLVGGTMMYFNALQYGIADLPPADTAVRARLDAEAAELGWQALHRRLAKIDPESASRIHPNDPQRLQRALEVYEITGKTLTELWQQQARQVLPYRLIKIALMPPERTGLRRRIAQRFEAMLDAGLIDEVRALRALPGVHADLPAMRSVGYRQVWQYLDGEIDEVVLRDRAVIATAQLAKRQMTWLRSEQNCNFIDPQALDVPKLLKSLGNLL